ncbi:NAD(P)-dependent oxidoreductase [Variovorax ginsengisoli]|uniref:3-hydroxyisobutyrate dehydrogenase-like beta-hydroxyacid dehydrogenase n=1 Tax=Variovorax ginsengisoli TaxID=363844 RepID=A0ABT9SAZ3_9BURK|nr:NAD(P)-dependent oxidoreductase [Variovorax ginsengisoli]MDP9900517.1 3-hydroxyisobutyrate dehydrogenase-like beta-hydroxyacid dehydrogenase [Variovorax ginsengisoli]
MKKIGMVGIGMMGHGIASNILKHGHALAVLEHAGNQPLDALQAAGATTFAKASELAAAVDVLILCVTGSPQVEAVIMGEGGVLQGLRPGTVIIDCSTAIPTSTERLAQAVHAAGGRFLDAPMTRTPKEAAEGRLNLLVGGDVALFDECRPLLACFAENITHAGPVGAGHRMKLLHNYVSLGQVALLAEAAACSERAGIAPEVLVDVLSKGGGGGMALERLKPYLLARDATGLRFTMSNALKDLGYYTAMAEAGHSARSIAEGVRQTLEGAVQGSDPQALVPELVAVLAQRGDGA